jgi:hypothetical protein
MPKAKKTITMTMEKATPGAVRYREDGWDGKSPDYALGTLYIRKTALDGSIPEKITVTIDY